MKRILFGLLACAAGMSMASAETTLTPSVTSANGSLDTVLTWESDRAICVGAGHPAWDGPKPSSGTLTLPTITMSGTYELTLTCSTPASTAAKLSWTPPTTNTDGTTLSNLSGYRIHYGRKATELTQTVQVANPGVSTYTLEDLAEGLWYFAVKAYTPTSESGLSNVVQKAITTEVRDEEVVRLTVNPIPSSPTSLSVE